MSYAEINKLGNLDLPAVPPKLENIMKNAKKRKLFDIRRHLSKEDLKKILDNFNKDNAAQLTNKQKLSILNAMPIVLFGIFWSLHENPTILNGLSTHLDTILKTLNSIGFAAIPSSFMELSKITFFRDTLGEMSIGAFLTNFSGLMTGLAGIKHLLVEEKKKDEFGNTIYKLKIPISLHFTGGIFPEIITDEEFTFIQKLGQARNSQLFHHKIKALAEIPNEVAHAKEILYKRTRDIYYYLLNTKILSMQILNSLGMLKFDQRDLRYFINPGEINLHNESIVVFASIDPSVNRPYVCYFKNYSETSKMKKKYIDVISRVASKNTSINYSSKRKLPEANKQLALHTQDLYNLVDQFQYERTPNFSSNAINFVTGVKLKEIIPIKFFMKKQSITRANGYIIQSDELESTPHSEEYYKKFNNVIEIHPTPIKDVKEKYIGSPRFNTSKINEKTKSFARKKVEAKARKHKKMEQEDEYINAIEQGIRNEKGYAWEEQLHRMLYGNVYAENQKPIQNLEMQALFKAKNPHRAF